jgi:hypothetical protein
MMDLRSIILLLLVLAFMAIVSIWTPFAFERIAVRWFSMPNILFFWWVPAATLLVAFATWRWLETLDHSRNFFPKPSRPEKSTGVCASCSPSAAVRIHRSGASPRRSTSNRNTDPLHFRFAIGKLHFQRQNIDAHKIRTRAIKRDKCRNLERQALLVISRRHVCLLDSDLAIFGRCR